VIRFLIIIWLAASAAFAGSIPGIRIIADIPGDAPYVDSVIAVTAARLKPLLGDTVPDSLDIFIVATAGKFDSLTENSIPDWGAGVAIPYLHRIVIKSPLILPGDKALGELVAHEYTHMALAARVGLQDVPRWLNEGMAMYLSAEWGWGDNMSIGWAVVVGNIVPLTEIEHLNRFGGSQAGIAYSESYLAFRYFLDTYGQSSLRILLDNFEKHRNIDRAFMAAMGGNYHSFEKEFMVYLRGRYNVVIVLFNSELFWIIVTALFIAAIVAVRLRRKRRLKELEQYDVYHSTDFDYGKPEEPDEDNPWD
jgi:hypothetical protein